LVTTTLSELTAAGLLVQENNGYCLVRGGLPKTCATCPTWPLLCTITQPGPRH
jgi:hypothetical protein